MVQRWLQHGVHTLSSQGLNIYSGNKISWIVSLRQFLRGTPATFCGGHRQHLRGIPATFPGNTGNFCGGYRQLLWKIPPVFAEDTGNFCGRYRQYLRGIPATFVEDDYNVLKEMFVGMVKIQAKQIITPRHTIIMPWNVFFKNIFANNF